VKQKHSDEKMEYDMSMVYTSQLLHSCLN
jgi:hypothetical protein